MFTDSSNTGKGPGGLHSAFYMTYNKKVSKPAHKQELDNSTQINTPVITVQPAAMAQSQGIKRKSKQKRKPNVKRQKVVKKKTVKKCVKKKSINKTQKRRKDRF